MDNFLQQVRQEINDWLDYTRAKREKIRDRLVKYVDQDKEEDKIWINTIYSVMQLGLAIKYSDETSVIVMPRKFWDEEYADNLTDLAKFDFDEMDLKRQNYQRDWDAQFTGVWIKRNKWRDDIRKVKVSEVADPLTWIPDPYGNYLNPFRYHYFEVEMLKSTMTEKYGFKEEEVGELTSQKIQELQSNASARDNATWLNSPLQDDNTDFYISVYDWYTYEDGKLYVVTVDEKKSTVLRKVLVDPVMKDEIETGSVDIKTQVNLTYFSPNRDAFGVALLDLIEDKQVANSILANLRLIDAKFSTFGQMNLVNTDMVKNTADLTRPTLNTKWIGVNAWGGNLSNAVYPVPRQSMMQDSYNVSSELTRQIQLDTWISENSLWVPSSKSMTLWESQQIQANANIRLALWISISNWGEEDFWKFMWLRGYYEFMEESETKFIRIANGFDSVAIEFRKDDFIGKESPDIKIESKKVVDQKRESLKIDFLTMLPYFIQNPETPSIIKKQAMRYAMRLQNIPREQIKLLTYDKTEAPAKHKLVLINMWDPRGAIIDSMDEDHQTYMVIFEWAIDWPIKEAAINARKEAYVLSWQQAMETEKKDEWQGMLNSMQSQMTSAAISQGGNKSQNIWNIAQNG